MAIVVRELKLKHLPPIIENLMIEDLDLLRTFLAIYRTANVTKAAAQLAISQPAATARLKTIEAAFRRKLFVRAGRGIAPTAAAHDLARAIEPYLDGLEAVVAATRVHDGGFGGTVHLGGPAEFLSARVLPALAHVSDVGVRMRVRLGLAAELISELAAGDLDLAVATMRVHNDAVAYEHLYREEFVLVGSPRRASHLATREGPALAEGEGAAPILGYAEDLPIIRRYWRDIFGKEPELLAALIIPDLRALIAAAVSGAGITVVPRYLCGEELSDGRLMLLHRPASFPGNDIYLAWNKFALRHPRNLLIKETITNAARGWS